MDDVLNMIPSRLFATRSDPEQLGVYLRRAQVAREMDTPRTFPVWDSLWYLASTN